MRISAEVLQAYVDKLQGHEKEVLSTLQDLILLEMNTPDASIGAYRSIFEKHFGDKK
jgi:hypothetical protein